MIRNRRVPSLLHHLTRTAALVLMLLSATTTLPNAASSQPALAYEIVIETSKKLPAGAATVVEIRKGQQNLIMLNEAIASADDLAEAVDAIRHVRAKYGDGLPRPIRLVAPPSKKGAANQKNREGSTSFGLLRLLKSQKLDRKTRSGKGEELVKRITLNVDGVPASKE